MDNYYASSVRVKEVLTTDARNRPSKSLGARIAELDNFSCSVRCIVVSLSSGRTKGRRVNLEKRIPFYLCYGTHNKDT